MKNIKQEKWSSMSNELLDDLLVINVKKVNVEDFNPDDSIELWWKAKTRHPNQKKRKEYRKKEMQSESTAATTSSGVDYDSSDSSVADMLEDWDGWIDDYF